MPLTCNIDSRGKFARLVYGVLLFALGIALMALWAHGSGSVLRWGLSAGCLLAGAFGIFEARAGWCVMRAMGFKTPM